MDGAEPQKNHENKFSLVSVMAVMLRDSVVAVVVRTRLRAIPLAMITLNDNQVLKNEFCL